MSSGEIKKRKLILREQNERATLRYNKTTEEPTTTFVLKERAAR